jgi:flagellar motor switch protein FliN/FliY
MSEEANNIVSLAAAGAGGAADLGAHGLPKAKERNLELILDIPLRVTVELGRTKMLVSELLNLGQGSVIELSKLAGEPMEVLVNDKLVARGEAVVVNEKFGVRLTDIISPAERVEQLK